MGNFVDAFILGVVGRMIGLFFFDDLVSLGAWGRLLGFALAGLYFVPLNSRLGGGRTLGKRWAGTCVVGNDGKPVGLATSAIRFSVLSSPVFLLNLPFLTTSTSNPLSFLMNAFSAAVGWSIIYLLLFNRRTRQSLHDLIAGTYVIRDYSLEPVPITARIWKGHLIGIILLVVLAASMSVFFGRILPRLLEKNDALKERITLYQKLSGEPEIASVDITWQPVRHRTRAEDEDVENDLPVKIMLRQKPASIAAEATKIAQIVLRESAIARKKNEIAVTVSYGYDIGIARDTRSETIAHSPREWAPQTP